jgi:hypothetical protein
MPISVSSSKPNCSVAANCTALGAAYNGAVGVDTFTATSGTYSFAPGDYVFCNFSATGTALINAAPSSSAPVRIFIDSPTSSRCSNDHFTQTGGVWNGGNFTAGNGINNGVGNGNVTGLANSVTTALASSGVQIYVVGDQSASSTPPYDSATSVNITSPPTCTGSFLGVCISLSNPLTQAYVVYAPTSSVTENVSGCLVGVLGACTLGGAGAFAGSLIGNDVTITATAITEDLNIGNFPLYAGVVAFRPVQYVQCDLSVTSLSGNAVSDTSGC